MSRSEYEKKLHIRLLISTKQYDSRYRFNVLTMHLNSNVYADCPRDLAIMSSSDVISPGTELTCVARAHPLANFRWFAVTGTGYWSSGSDSQTLTVRSCGSGGSETCNVHFECTAFNFLGGDGRKPCFATVELRQYIDDQQPVSGQIIITPTTLFPARHCCQQLKYIS